MKKLKLEEGLQGCPLRRGQVQGLRRWLDSECGLRVVVLVQKRKILAEPCTPEITTQQCTRTKKRGSNRHKQNKTVSRGKQQEHAHISTRTHIYTSGCVYVYVQRTTCKYTYMHAYKYMHICVHAYNIHAYKYMHISANHNQRMHKDKEGQASRHMQNKSWLR